ncbi:MAG: YkvA family protein [Saprospiraceae bacterium]
MAYIQSKVSAMGVKLVYSALLMIYAYKSERTPSWAKRIIIGAMAYLLSPIDTIPDLTPFIGFTDDLGVLSFALVTIACYIDEDVRQKAKTRLNKMFTNPSEKDIKAVDDCL